MSSYLQQFTTRPELVDYTIIICSHPVHGIDTYYLPDDKWNENLVPILRTYWVHGYTVLMQPNK